MPLDRNRILKSVDKLRKIIDDFGPEPSPDEVHDLRTNTRRFEAMFQSLSLDVKAIGGNATLKDLRRLRKRAGKVRDIDVLTSFASTVHPKDEDECVIRLLEHLGTRSRKYAKSLHLEVRRLRPALRKHLKDTQSELRKCIPKASGFSSENEAVGNATAAAVKLAAAAGGTETLRQTEPSSVPAQGQRLTKRLKNGCTRLRGQVGCRPGRGEGRDW
jgi:CHAD domain-containing protein